MDEGGVDEITAVDGTHLQSKEGEYSSLKAHGANMMESHEMITPSSSEGKNLDRSGVLDHHPFVGPRCTDDSGGMVEELTLRNYDGTNLAVVGTSNNRDRMHRPNQWQHFCQMLGGSGNGSSLADAAFKDNGRPPSTVWDDVGYTFFPDALGQKPSDDYHNEVMENASNTENKAGSSNTLSAAGGIRTKMLSKSGFSEYFVKNTLKGKGVICRGPTRDHSISKDSGSAQAASDAPLISSPKTSLHPSHGFARPGSGLCPDSIQGGVNLRECLKTGRPKINKLESLHIFRQVLDLVDFSHSQGLALQDLRPSCFKLLPSNQVIYLGSSAQKEMMENDSDQNISCSENDRNGKRPLEQGTHPAVGQWAKKQKFGGKMKAIRQWPQFTSRSGFKSATANDTGVSIPGPQDSGSDFNEGHNLKMEYKSRGNSGSPRLSNTSQLVLGSVNDTLEEKWYTSPDEVNGRGCTFFSNIYSLGVLLFELLGSFDTGRARAAAMLDLHHRILPPNFLSENPKEAGFCLWLLHPEPPTTRHAGIDTATRQVLKSIVLDATGIVPAKCCVHGLDTTCQRVTLFESSVLPGILVIPRTRAILQSDFVRGIQGSCEDELSSNIKEDDGESELLLHFLMSLKEQKQKDTIKLGEEIKWLETDIEEVERRQIKKSPDLSCSSKGSLAWGNRFLNTEKLSSGLHSNLLPVSSKELRLTRNMNQLESAYFSVRTNIQLSDIDMTARTNNDVLKYRDSCLWTQKDEEKPKPTDRLGAFFNGLCKYARYSKFEVRGTLRNGDFNSSANVICSLSFDRDEDYFATAGVSKKIKIFEFHALFNDSVDNHYPVVEMSNRSKLSCICWNSYIRNYLASTDYDGIVKLWDAGTGQGFSQYIEHDKRAWSVDFSQVDPTKLASASDDCTVKLWNINERNSLSTIRNIANVCCVQFSSHSTHLLAFGSADYKTYCYDLRNVSTPWCVLAGHDRAVSYVKFLDSETLVSASTDNSLKLWDLNKTCSNGLLSTACSLTLKGHTNEKNFVGLSVADGYIACGSETNEVYAYYRSLPMPVTSHKFGSIDPISGKETDDDNGQFVSSVCWRRKSDMVVAANSTGCIKVLEMV